MLESESENINFYLNLIVKALYGAIRSVISILIAYIFIVAVMTASAQQDVLSKLVNSKEDYSTAKLNAHNSDNLKRQIDILQYQQQVALREQSNDTALVQKLSDAYNDAWDDASSTVQQILAIKNCAMRPATPGSEIRHVDEWRAAMQCKDNVEVPARLRAQMAALGSQSNNLLDVFQQWEAAQRTEASAEQVLQREKDAIAALSAQEKDTEADGVAFTELRVLSSTPLLAGGLLAELPPSMLEYLLAFISGSFGALLLMIVLAVYPRTVFGFATSSSFYNRILLGGLISVCVYIFLESGSAVLGSAPSNGAPANFLTYSAVGIMAGMFSDRVAFWLSRQANVFFNVDDVSKPSPSSQGKTMPDPP